MFGEREKVEGFHVALLGEMRLPRGQYAIKGGLNLRLFHGSPRLSGDLDIDVDSRAPSPTTLRNTVDRVLGGAPFARRLRRAGLTIQAVSRPKQTDTVQRWKVQLLDGSRPLHTKVEFSRRGLSGGIEVGFIDPEVVRAHGVATPVPLAHYGAQAALEQKLSALIGRAEPQARDVFDLHLLLRGGVVPTELGIEARRQAVERAMAMGFAVFRSQVLAYLPPEVAVDYDAPDVWDAMLLSLVSAIEGSAS